MIDFETAGLLAVNLQELSDEMVRSNPSDSTQLESTLASETISSFTHCSRRAAGLERKVDDLIAAHLARFGTRRGFRPQAAEESHAVRFPHASGGGNATTSSESVSGPHANLRSVSIRELIIDLSTLIEIIEFWKSKMVFKDHAIS